MFLIKVLIANPPAYLYDDSKHYIQAGSRWSHTIPIPKGSNKRHYLPYPFYIGYASALLKKETNAIVKAFDACAHDFDELQFIDYIVNFNPDVLVIEIPTISFPLVMRALREIKETLDCVLIITGFHVSALWQSILNKYPFIDYCIIGEYEFILNEFVLSLSDRKHNDVKKISGVAFRESNHIHINPLSSNPIDLDVLPYPDREDLDISHYSNKLIVGEPSIVMWSSRGCPFKCSFCLEQQVLYKPPIYRIRHHTEVVNEMEFCIDNYHAKQIDFDDQTMTGQRWHVRQICREMLSRKLDIPWVCMGDMNLDYETLKLMRDSGCRLICFGVETIHSEVLKNTGKQFVKKSKAKRFREWCQQLGIKTHATYMVGLPGDTKQGLGETIEFAKQLNTDSAQFSIATPFPGTTLYGEALINGWLSTFDWTQYDGVCHSVLDYPHLTKEEIEFHYKIMVNMWKHHIKRRELRNPLKLINKGVTKCLGYLKR